MKIVNKKNNAIIVSHAKRADTFLTRMIGLLGKEALFKDEGLVITHCQSIHMFFMRFAIDVVFANKNNIVVGLVQRIQPFHLSPIFVKASYAIELPEGTILDKKISLGDQLELIMQ